MSMAARPVSAKELEGDLVQPGDPRYGIVWVNPNRVSGAPCFFGTRVPVQNLFDCIEAGETIADFLSGDPPFARDPAGAVL